MITAQDFKNPDLPVEQRAADLVSRLTLEEKVLQMQNSAPAIPRLDIPAYDWWNEALHGVARAGVATVFPQAIGLAATWDTDLMHRVADAISTEARAKYNEALRNDNHRRYYGLTFWSPNINIFRDPRWGRGQETYGEDPFLTSRLAVAFVTGMQGSDPKYLKVIATPKHFAVHSGPEPLRHEFDARPTARDLNDTYLPAFRATVVEGKAMSIMCAYNRVDGVPACASSILQQLRDEWGFQGYVVSDCGAVSDMVKGHKYKSTMPEAAATAVKAGTDLTCGGEYGSLVQAVGNGTISEAEIDRSLQRLFAARIRLGMFDPVERVPYSTIPMAENDSPAHRQLALEAARKSIVLLKNAKQFLPLRPDVRRIAVIGPAADDPNVLLGNYNGVPSRIVTALEGLQRRFDGKAEIRFALGSTYTAQSPALAPSEVLITGDRQGLLAEYFDNADLSGQPRLSRVEPRLYSHVDMRDSVIASKIPRQEFSVRWSGAIRVPYAGDYAIGVTPSCKECGGDYATRLFLDDRLLVENGRRNLWVAETPTGRVHLEAGRSYTLRVEYRHHGGSGGIQLAWIPPAAALLKEAADAVKASDVAIAFVGLNPTLEGEEMENKIAGFAGGDRTDIQLPAPQQQLLRAALATGTPVVIVLMSGSAPALNPLEKRAAAVLATWYAGEEGGTAIAETLAGDNNPSGRLPVTFYRSVDQLPPFEDYSMRGRTYRYFAKTPLYPFGCGLSYSSFRYSDLRVEGGSVSVRVTNSSQREGQEVVQLYVRGRQGSDAPIRELRGFERVHLGPGEGQVVRFSLGPGDVGARISVGGGQPLKRWTGTSYIETQRRK